MKRILINETPKLVGNVVTLAGWVHVRRDHGKLIFIDLRDRSGIIQMVVIPDKEKAYKLAKNIRSEYVISVSGLIKERPESQVKDTSPVGRLEMEVADLDIISQVEEELPFDISKNNLELTIPTLLDNRNLSLRNPKINSIFKVYSQLLKSYSDTMRTLGFLEIKSPKIVSSATEGGANFFKIKYFKQEAYLAQSPQFYKQAGVGAFERVFEVGSVFRAEPHFTTRHVNEYIGFDAEMGFIESFSDIMDHLEYVAKRMLKDINKNCRKELAEYGMELEVPSKIPRIRLSEALDVLKNEYKKEGLGMDIDPEGERLISEWAKKKYKSDLIFLTHYPTKSRPFYTMPSLESKYTESFDLLFRGVEIATGGQRIHNYKQLVANIKKHKLNPKDFQNYLEIFKLGMPPHGGWGMGSERILQKILGLSSIKEVILFPRDVKRLNP
jgi:nondiscriminating aspartyl-tRNA synthetase